MSLAIEAHHISKRFFLGERNQRTFFEDVWTRTLSGVRRVLRPTELAPVRSTRRDFWALRDVSFQLHGGETLAIIGENEAGKSTLVEILSTGSQPTIGNAMGYGRFAGLVEVVAGCLPEIS